MLTDLKDKVVLITGSGKKSGIGYAMAGKLAELGSHIIIADYGNSKDFNADMETGTMDEMKLIEKEKISYHQKPYESYVFAKLILENFGELYENFYEVQDTDIVDNLFYEALELLDSICQSKMTPFEFKEEIFEDILMLSQESYFNKNSSYYDAGVDLDLLSIVSVFATTEEIFQILNLRRGCSVRGSLF